MALAFRPVDFGNMASCEQRSAKLEPKKWSIYNVFCCMFMPHFALLLVRIGYSYISLFVERFVSTLISFMAPSFLSLWSPVHFWRKKVWSFEAAVTFPVRSVLGLVVYLSSPRHDIRPTAAATFPKTNSCNDCNISIPSDHWALRIIPIKHWHPATKIHISH